MELTKEQIQYIDHRLENEGVKYWDIRIELLDHVVSDVEKKLNENSSEADFKKMVQNSFVFLGWNGSFDDLTKQRLFGINKMVRKQYFNQIIQLFINVNSILGIMLFVSCYSFIFLQFSIKFFKITSIIMLLLPVIYGLLSFFKEFSISRKTGLLTYSSFYIFFSFLMLNAFIQFLQPNGIFGTSKENYKMVFFIVTIFNSIFSVAGILVHLKKVKEVKNLEKKLFA